MMNGRTLVQRSSVGVRLAVWTSCLAFVLSIAGCSGDSNPTAHQIQKVPATLVGTWEFQSASIDGYPIGLSLALQWIPNTMSAKIHIKGEGSCVYEQLDGQSVVIHADTADFSVSGNQFSVSPGTLPVNTDTWTVSGTNLILGADVSGHDFELIAKKAIP